MDKLQKVWILAESESAAAELTSGAKQLGEQTALLQCENKESNSFLSYLPSLMQLVKEQMPQLVLVEASKNGRLAAAAIVAASGGSLLSNAAELAVEAGAVTSRSMVYGGAAFMTAKAAAATVVACLPAGVFEADGSAADEVLSLQAAESGVQLKENRPLAARPVNLAAAKVVVGVGRGFGSEENLPMARELAAALGGEVGCSRPVAEEEKWLPKEAYLGVSGAMIKPDVYIACGISGQVQHMVGVNQAKTIIAINKDKNAPIFKQCDYGLVGDLTTVLPALAAKFAK